MKNKKGVLVVLIIVLILLFVLILLQPYGNPLKVLFGG